MHRRVDLRKSKSRAGGNREQERAASCLTPIASLAGGPYAAPPFARMT